mgnify:FL=1
MREKLERVLAIAETITDDRAADMVALLRDVVGELRWRDGVPVWKLDYSPLLFSKDLGKQTQMTVRFDDGETKICSVNPMPFLGTEMALVGRGLVV